MVWWCSPASLNRTVSTGSFNITFWLPQGQWVYTAALYSKWGGHGYWAPDMQPSLTWGGGGGLTPTIAWSSAALPTFFLPLLFWYTTIPVLYHYLSPLQWQCAQQTGRLNQVEQFRSATRAHGSKLYHRSHWEHCHHSQLHTYCSTNLAVLLRNNKAPKNYLDKVSEKKKENLSSLTASEKKETEQFQQKLHRVCTLLTLV